jgi:hypothetical protein
MFSTDYALLFLGFHRLALGVLLKISCTVCSCGGPGGAWQLWVPGGSFVVGVISVFLCCLLLAVFGWLLLASLGKPSTQAMMFQDTIG